MTKKFNFAKTIETVQATMKKDERRANQFGLGGSLVDMSKDPKDYVVMNDWWSKNYGVLGLRFGHIVQIAGDPDTGKTSISLEAIRRAQEQGYGVLYAETENKTGRQDLVNAGIDPEGVMILHTAITEELYDGIFKLSDQFFKDFPKEKLLLVVDSYGQTLSMRDSEIDMTEQSQKPGGAAKTNRLGLNALVSRMQTDPIAVLIVNYHYDNVGSVGKTNAGGKGLGFFSMLIIQTQRTGWVDATRQGQKVRLGARVKWRCTKNHYSKSNIDEAGNQIPLPPEVNLKITAAGIEVDTKADSE